ncbi:MAG: PilT protein domain protein [Myxococcaceae bacterium]|nr:PilT protein domain protein [Myxococcaceae bacterium]
MGAVIDTDVLIDLERTNTAEALNDDVSLPSGELRVSLVSIAELQMGVEFADTSERRAAREAYLRFVSRNYLVEPITREVAQRAGKLFAELRVRKRGIGAHDVWIAAYALCLDEPVVTANWKHFTQVLGLKIIPWTKR